MEIIKKGIPPSEREHTATCNTCNTQVKFKQHEARVVPDSREGNYLTLGCPVCHATINVAINRPQMWSGPYDR